MIHPEWYKHRQDSKLLMNKSQCSYFKKNKILDPDGFDVF